MPTERVVITGIGIISPVGIGREKFWKGIVEGRSGVKRVSRIAAEQQAASKIAAEITDFDPTQFLDHKQIKRTDRFIQFAVAASKLAVQDAKIDLTKDDPFRVGVVVGSAAGGFQSKKNNICKDDRSQAIGSRHHAVYRDNRCRI